MKKQALSSVLISIFILLIVSPIIAVGAQSQTITLYAKGGSPGKENLQLFVSMFQFNYNYRNLNPMEKFTELLHTMLCTPSVI